MKYTILCSLLLVGVCFGNILEQRRYAHDDTERMRDMDKRDNKQDSNRGSDMQDTKAIEEDSQKQKYDSQRQGYNAQGQGSDTQRQDYDSQSRDDDSQKQSFESRRQDLNSQQQENVFQKQGYRTNKNFGWEQRDFVNQKLHQSEKVDSDDQSRDGPYVEQEIKKDEHQWMLPNNQRPQAFLGLGDLGQQFSNYVRGIFGSGLNNSHEAKVYSDEVPSFVDPLQIGDVDTSFALITTKYNHVHLYGLSNAYTVILSVDTKKQQIVAKIPLNKVEIKGQYTYSSRPLHNFTITLVDAVYVQTTSFTVKDNKVQLGESSVKIQYSRENSIYDRIGFIAQVLQGQLGKHLVTSIAPKIQEYVSPKLTSLVEHTVLDVTNNLERAHIVSGLQEGVYQTFKKIQAHLATNGNTNIELNSHNSPEYQHNHYRAHLVSVSLQNIQNITLHGNRVTFTETMVHSYVNVSLSQPTIAAVISYHSHQDTEKHQIHVLYAVDNISAKLELHKDLSGGQLQLASVKVKVSYVHIAPSQGHYHGELAGLVNLMGSKLHHFVSHSLEDFITTQVTGILAKVNSTKQSHSQLELKYNSENGYSGKGHYSENGQSGKGEYSGNGHTDMGQYGSEQNSNRGYSGSSRQQYPGNME